MQPNTSTSRGKNNSLRVLIAIKPSFVWVAIVAIIPSEMATSRN
jgi:hypothetical protein